MQAAILSQITLAANELNKLDEVVITKKKPFVENKIDRTVVNVDAFITAAGGDAMDVLEKSPGISVDQNGTITFKGKSGVQVYIDDKPTYLSGAELEAYLKSLPISTLDKIELITNPPAKYDAAGGAGIINIVSKNAFVAGPNNVGYGSAKAAQAHMTRLLAAELGEDQIRVNTVNPDAVIADSNIWAGGWAEGRAKAYGITIAELPAFYAKRTILNKSVLPEDIANACFAFVGGLLSKSTGNALNVDGGVAAGFLR